METIISEFVKVNPGWTVAIVLVVLILPVPSHIFMTIAFLKFYKSSLNANQEIFNQVQGLAREGHQVIRSNSRDFGMFSAKIDRCHTGKDNHVHPN